MELSKDELHALDAAIAHMEERLSAYAEYLSGSALGTLERVASCFGARLCYSNLHARKDIEDILQRTRVIQNVLAEAMELIRE